MKQVCIGDTAIGPDYSPYVVAELSANHNGSLETAMETVRAAARCGADAVKLQTYTADSMTLDCDSPDFMIRGGLWDGYKLYDLYREAATPFEWHKPLFKLARSLSLDVFATPFDEAAVDFLETLDAPAYKIASFELTDLPLIAYMAKTDKPLIMSTGMASLEEISEAVTVARNNGSGEIILLHCISAYPAPMAESNLVTIQDLATRFNCVVGLSDHTEGTVASVAAVAFGASFIEKHFILDRKVKGPDSAFSIEPDELGSLCHDVNQAWQAIGHAGYERKQSEQANLRFRRSLYFAEDMKAGDLITKDHVRRIRPGFGLKPKHFDKVIGRCVKQSVRKGTPVSWAVLSDG